MNNQVIFIFHSAKLERVPTHYSAFMGSVVLNSNLCQVVRVVSYKFTNVHSSWPDATRKSDLEIWETTAESLKIAVLPCNHVPSGLLIYAQKVFE